MDEINQPQVYQIEVRGLLPQNWEDCFNGAAIRVETAEDGTSITVMTQVVADQAALQGILNRLCDLNLRLISCNQIAQPGNGDFTDESQRELDPAWDSVMARYLTHRSDL